MKGFFYMNCNNEYLGKYISLIHRQANVFFTKEFSKFGFGSGQYMFLIHLYKILVYNNIA